MWENFLHKTIYISFPVIQDVGRIPIQWVPPEKTKYTPDNIFREEYWITGQKEFHQVFPPTAEEMSDLTDCYMYSY